MRRIVYQNHFLEEVARLLQEGSSVRVRIDGESMHPFIAGGRDEVLLIPYDKKTPIELWSCIFYKWKGLFLHPFVLCNMFRICLKNLYFQNNQDLSVLLFGGNTLVCKYSRCLNIC